MKLSALVFLVALLGTPCSFAPAQVHSAGRTQVQNLTELRKKIQGDNRNHPVASVRWGKEALAMLAQKPDPTAEIWFLTTLLDDLITLSEYGQVEHHLRQGRNLAARLGDPRGGFLMEMRAAILLLHTGKPADSEVLLRALLPSLESYRLRHPQDQEINQATGSFYRLQGLALQTLGRFSDAVAAYQASQRISEQFGNLREQAIVLNQMGTVYAGQDRIPEAVASHRQAIQMAETLGDLGLQAAFHLDLANTYRVHDESEAQLSVLNQALALAREAGNVGFQIAGLVNLADVYLRRREYQAALRLADQALALPGTRDDPGNAGVCLVNRGIALNRLGNSAEGLESLREGLRLIKATEDRSQIVEITGNLAEEYAFAGEFRKAYEAAREFKALDDARKGEKDRRNLAEASAAFEADKRHYQIESLQREQRIQARLMVLWIALGLTGLTAAGVLVVGRKRLQRMNTKLEKANAALAEVITVDPLTGLKNRRYLSMAMQEETARLQRLFRENPQAEQLTFLMIDIDHFKAINDTHGHGVGDQVLIQMARLLRSVFREADTLVRFGGEEFLVVAKGADRSNGPTIANNILEAFRGHAFTLADGRTGTCTCSVGFAAYPFMPQLPNLLSWEATVDLADQCLYAAKQSGRNGWVGISAGETLSAPEDLNLLPTRLDDLIRRGLISPHSSFPDPGSLQWKPAQLQSHSPVLKPASDLPST